MWPTLTDLQHTCTCNQPDTEIPLFFFMKVPDAFQKLIDNVESTMRHAIVEEEHIPMETVTNFDEVGHVLT